MIGVAVTETAPACQSKPLASVAVATCGATGTVVIVGRMTFALLSVSVVNELAVCVPVDVTALPLMVHWPFLNATTPVVALNASVGKLIVSCDTAASAATGATSLELNGCRATTVSVPELGGLVQFITRST